MTTHTSTKATELPPTYVPAQVEPAILKQYLDTKAYAAFPEGVRGQGPSGQGDEPGHSTPSPLGPSAPPYSIVIPPPNVTAALHLGHALNNTLQDVLTRVHRMRGFNTLWMPGTDHAGIATQTVVDKRLQQEGKPSLKDYKQQELKGEDGRGQFIARVTEWKDEYEQTITNQLKEMGCSCDWDRQRFTMDDQCAKAVRQAFFQLFKDGLIYRGKRLVNWDPASQTALADDEVEMQEIDGNFYYMKYPVCDAQGNLTGEFATVATTRPETMLGDTAVAVNPSDAPRAKYVGQFVKLPIVNRVIPIIADDYVVIPLTDADAERSEASGTPIDNKAKMASGFLKVTPAHDPNDYEIGTRHNLKIINVMAPDASISIDHGWPTEENPKENKDLLPLVGLTREEARKAIVRWFKDHDLMAEVKPYRHAVGHSYRSHVPIEPYYTDQWYVKVTDPKLAGAALDSMNPAQYAGEPRRHDAAHGDGELTFTPERYAKTFQTWHENIRDWCISRQLWWGHRIPVWFRESTTFGDEGPAFEAQTNQWAREGRICEILPGDQSWANVWLTCVRDENDREVIEYLEANGFERDPDVLDTWFSSALWPLSTMGWPDNTPELAKWNPTSVLCTAREIITLWVSRMVMFNLYFSGQGAKGSRGLEVHGGNEAEHSAPGPLNPWLASGPHLPFKDVFIHAMIQDGHGQKMSKSLGNGVDPMDIIHSHGADAMRFTLTKMTTQTQDVRLPVDMVDPHTGETFTPEYVTASGGVKVAAPIQTRNGKQMVSSYGVASGKAVPTDDMPAARNTSEKFDEGQRFANKLWNAFRFALSNLENLSASPRIESVGFGGELALADRWILNQLTKTIKAVDRAIDSYAFSDYATAVYDFFWRDLCDWYIEIVKRTVKDNPVQQRVLATCLDAALRLLHPAMPFITERLWQALNAQVPAGWRGVDGFELKPNDTLIHASWPAGSEALLDVDAERDFELIRQIVIKVREARTAYKIPPRQEVEATTQAPAPIAQLLLENRNITQPLTGCRGRGVGPHVDRPANSAAVLVGEVTVYLHDVVDVQTEKARLEKLLADKQKQVKTFEARLSNEKYVSSAPAHLVQETRDQHAAALRELEQVQQQLASLMG